VRVILIVGIIAVALWWAGFAPFPQHPVYADTGCTQNPATKQDMDTYGRLRSCSLTGNVSGQKPGQWITNYGPGWTQCPPSIAIDPKTGESAKAQCFSWKQTHWYEIPAFGLSGSNWVALRYVPDNQQKPNGNFMDAIPVAAYHSYAACWFANRNDDAACEPVGRVAKND
jgi:hypothetical protein